MNFRTQERKRGLSLDITPLVDTVFNLMIFFALSMNFIANPGMRINLPESSSASPIRERKNVEIIITMEGKLYLNDEEIKDIYGQLKKMFASGNYDGVVVKADRYTPHGRVVEVLDAAREAGFTKLAVATGVKKK